MERPDKTPKVSVCVITYNQEQYIRQCLQSILDQETDFDFEVIIGEDCSTDGTRAIVQAFARKYPTIIRTIFQEKNTGGSKNYLDVHAAAIGKYVAHVDGDDYVLPGKLQAQANVLDAELTCNAVWHRVDYFNDSGEFCSGKTADLSIFNDGKVQFDQAVRLGFIGVHSALMYRRSAREPVELNKKVLDIFLTWDLLSKGTGYFLNEVLGKYRVAASGSLSLNSFKQSRRLLLEHADLFRKKFPEQRKNFFLWAISHAIVDFKNLRSTAMYFVYFSLKTISLVTPKDIYSNLTNMRRTQVRWRQRERI